MTKVRSYFDEDRAWAPGFRFHPTDEELVLFYLKKKICRRLHKPDIIAVTDVYKWDPEDLPGQSKLKNGDRQWFFFCPRDTKKYPSAARSNRATGNGYWKATGKDRNITCNSRTVGIKKTLVFYRGRAPKGERTDWVMHEYSMDEEELRRCPTVQDSYVLCKVYKKSGPGPKNGEQYGAPFKEEEWADDDCSDVNNNGDQENPVKANVSACVDNFRMDDLVRSPLNAVEEIVNGIADEPILDQLNGYSYAPLQVIFEEETQSTMVDPSLLETIVAEPCTLLHPSNRQFDLQTDFDFTQLTSSQLQLYEAPEVTSAPNICEHETHLAEEDFVEIDDLSGPEPTFPNVEAPVNNLQFEEIGGLSELDLYHDAAMFLRDMGPVDQGPAVHPYLNNLENGLVNQLDYQLPHSNAAEEISSQLWTHDQQADVFTSAELCQVAVPPPTTGVLDTGTPNHPAEANQINASEHGDGAGSSFTSSLWAFLESIPTTPASASENALVKGAFERMSSFSRVRVKARSTDDDDDAAAASRNGAAPVRQAAGRTRGFLYFSVIVAISAIFWVFMRGTVGSVLARYLAL